MSINVIIPQGVRITAIVFIFLGMIAGFAFLYSLSQLTSGNYVPEPQKDLVFLGSSSAFDEIFAQSILILTISLGVTSVLLFVPGLAILGRKPWGRIWADLYLGFIMISSILQVIAFILRGFIYLAIIGIIGVGVALFLTYLLHNKNAEQFFVSLKYSKAHLQDQISINE